MYEVATARGSGYADTYESASLLGIGRRWRGAGRSGQRDVHGAAGGRERVVVRCLEDGKVMEGKGGLAVVRVIWWEWDLRGGTVLCGRGAGRMRCAGRRGRGAVMGMHRGVRWVLTVDGMRLKLVDIPPESWKHIGLLRCFFVRGKDAYDGDGALQTARTNVPCVGVGYTHVRPPGLRVGVRRRRMRELGAAVVGASVPGCELWTMVRTQRVWVVWPGPPGDGIQGGRCMYGFLVPGRLRALYRG
ncbi:hypothetical protein B0H16DRAFT_1469288 [Mycena metata]|uniref:Uncharacterized protein n=1 Tax=Mycena metata TaxID=1033252 RepID=A0AAD7HZU3_9AGAR|nr:hypothetical protein B0H16DRAFT_1469288 [Mycena metata]